jgi:hypothetical protein
MRPKFRSEYNTHHHNHHHNYYHHQSPYVLPMGRMRKEIDFSWICASDNKVTRTGVAQSVQWLTTGWTFRGSNPGGGGEIFSTRPDRPWSPPSLLCDGYRFFPVGKAVGKLCWPPPPSIAEVKERVELHIYCPSGPSRPVLGWTLPLTYLKQSNISSIVSLKGLSI